MYLFKRENSPYWWFEFRYRGERVRESSNLKNRTQASDFASTYRADLVTGKIGVVRKKESEKPQTLGEFITKVVLPAVDDMPKVRTRAFYRQVLENHILKCSAIAKRPLAEIDAPHIDAFRAYLRRYKAPNGRKLGVTTANNSLRVLKKALKMAYRHRKTSWIPEIKIPKARERQFVLVGAMREEFIGGLPEPARTLAPFLCDSALRISEACALTWDRVHLDGDQPFITIDEGKSDESARMIPLTREAKKILEKQKTISRSQYVFVRFGPRVAAQLQFTAAVSRHTVSQQFRERRVKMGLPTDCVLHATRHTAGTDMVAAGVDAFTIQKVLGHASVTTTQRYVKMRDQMIFGGIEKLGKYRDSEQAKRRPVLAVAKRKK